MKIQNITPNNYKQNLNFGLVRIKVEELPENYSQSMKTRSLIVFLQEQRNKALAILPKEKIQNLISDLMKNAEDCFMNKDELKVLKEYSNKIESDFINKVDAKFQKIKDKIEKSFLKFFDNAKKIECGTEAYSNKEVETLISQEDNPMKYC